MWLTLHDDSPVASDAPEVTEGDRLNGERTDRPPHAADARVTADKPAADAEPGSAASDGPEVAAPAPPPAPAKPRGVPLPAGWTDALTETEGPELWHRIIETERARVQRYKRPVTIAFVELVGLEALGERWGIDVAERAIIKVARTLIKSARTSDHIARIERSRFGVLLTETGEIPAINFVERARAACEREVGSVALEYLKIGFGWASPPSGDLAEAIDLARQRLAADLDGQ